jgi:hypothetical protein
MIPPSARLFVQAVAIVAAVVGIAFLLDDDGEYVDYRRGLRVLDPQTVEPRARVLEVVLYDLPASTTVVDKNSRADVVLTSWYTYSKDPQRKIQVSSKSIEYIHDLYVTATHFKVPLVVFHNDLTDEFVEKYSNDYVSFRRVEIKDPAVSTNDFRFFPYLEYVKKEQPDSILMVDASDVFFNTNPFNYIHEHEGPKDQLFVSDDNGPFTYWSWMVNKCYGNSAKGWPKGNLYNAGVWGGKGPAVQCVLECVAEQIDGPLKGKGNCNMPAVNYCINHGPCKDVAPVHEDPKFVNPLNTGCDEKYDVVHNKCPDTQYKTRVSISQDQVKLVQSKMTHAGRKAMRMAARRCDRTGKC